MVYLLKIVIFHGYVSHNQMVVGLVHIEGSKSESQFLPATSHDGRATVNPTGVSCAVILCLWDTRRPRRE